MLVQDKENALSDSRLHIDYRLLFEISSSRLALRRVETI
jgi:hypothetical protein